MYSFIPIIIIIINVGVEVNAISTVSLFKRFTLASSLQSRSNLIFKLKSEVKNKKTATIALKTQSCFPLYQVILREDSV